MTVQGDSIRHNSPSWFARLRFDPLPALLTASNPAIPYFTRRDLLIEEVPPVETLWELPAPRGLLRRQLPNGAWPYPGGGKPEHRLSEDYDQIETYRNLAFLEESGTENLNTLRY